MTRQWCERPYNFVTNDDDCNDYDSDIHPGAAEDCNEVDDDCDGTVDEGCSSGGGGSNGSDCRICRSCSSNADCGSHNGVNETCQWFESWGNFCTIGCDNGSYYCPSGSSCFNYTWQDGVSQLVCLNHDAVTNGLCDSGEVC